jgi:esterase/lipase superfamily enzyme
MTLSSLYIQVSGNQLQTHKNNSKIPTYLTSSKEGESYKGVQGSGYGNYTFSNINDLFTSCPREIVIFVHGWNATEHQAMEQLDRVKMSLENNNYTNPLVGYSWGSDSEWIASQYIAKWNGPILADFILKLNNSCNVEKGKDMQIRIIGHSLGSRVILSS